MTTGSASAYANASNDDGSEQVARRLLVCAPRGAQDSPLVEIADGSYETVDERVFWRDRREAEVLRLPLQAAVAERALKRFPDGPLTDGEAQLLAAVAEHRPSSPSPTWPTALATPLAQALLGGDGPAAVAAAIELCAVSSLARVHSVLSACLDEVSDAAANGYCDALEVHTTTACVRMVLTALQPSPPRTWDHLVVLAPVPGDRHTLGLHAIGQQLREAGHATLVVDEPSIETLVELGAHSGVQALVLSAHLELPAGKARRLVTALREQRPEALLAAGGPGFPASARSQLDLVTDDVPEVVAALQARANPLTEREQEVLLLVAEGRTNGDIAEELCISAATVKTHLDHVFAKTGSVHRSAAVARALRQGWIH
jgi:DNA-binding CsgD family transcriptional regulator